MKLRPSDKLIPSIDEVQCTSSFILHMQYMVLVSKLSDVQFVAGITNKNKLKNIADFPKNTLLAISKKA